MLSKILAYKMLTGNKKVLINDKNPAISIEIAGFLAGEEGFEPSAYGFGDRRSAN